MTEEREKLEQEFEELYNKILDGLEWEIEDLDRLLEVNLKLNQDMHLVVAAMSGEAYVAKIKKDGTMSDNRQKIPKSEVLAFIHNWATAEAERLDSDVISVTRGGVEVLEIKVKDRDFAVDLSECKYED